MKILCSLTPGGSEFADEPEFCAEYIRKRFSHSHNSIKAYVKENRELKASNKKLVNDIANMFLCKSCRLKNSEILEKHDLF